MSGSETVALGRTLDTAKAIHKDRPGWVTPGAVAFALRCTLKVADERLRVLKDLGKLRAVSEGMVTRYEVV